jgi:hypothetical protein
MHFEKREGESKLDISYECRTIKLSRHCANLTKSQGLAIKYQLIRFMFIVRMSECKENPYRTRVTIRGIEPASDRNTPGNTPSLGWKGRRKGRAARKCLHDNALSPPACRAKQPDQCRHPSISLSTAIDRRRTGGLGLDPHSRRGLLGGSKPSAVGIGRAASQNIVGRVRPPCFAGADKLGG